MNPLYRMLQRMSSWVLFSTGWGRRTILQWLSLGTRIFIPTAPMYSVSDMINSSRIGSMAGLVTWANCCRK